METTSAKPDENNLSDDLGEAGMRNVIHNARVLLTDPRMMTQEASWPGRLPWRKTVF